jgi:hypothetical protein
LAKFFSTRQKTFRLNFSLKTDGPNLKATAYPSHLAGNKIVERQLSPGLPNGIFSNWVNFWGLEKFGIFYGHL